MPASIVRIAILAAVYVAAARLGLMMDAVAGFATLVWAPTGIALVALLRGGTRLWPGVAVGALVANAWTGAPIAVACGIAAGNTLEAVLGVWTLQRFGFDAALSRIRDVLALVGFAALASPIASATIGVASLYLGDIVTLAGTPAAWRAWWLGDAIGDLVVAPVLLALTHAWRLPRRRRGEAAALAFALLALSAFVFFGPVREQWYLVFPVLMWAALRFGTRGAAIATFVVVAIAVAGTAIAGGELFQLQAFMAVVAVTMLVLGAASRERDEAVRRRDEMLEMVSHELKTPLSSVHMSADVLLDRLPDDDRLRKPAAVVIRSADRMAALVQNLLDLAAIDSDRLRVEIAEHDLAALAEETVEMLRPLARDKAQTLELVRGTARTAVACDRERVLQIAGNLVGNAIKYAPKGATITVSVDGATLVVRDTGPGIARDQLPRVFDRYWRAAGHARSSQGLGLFITRRLVEAQRGTISVDSELGKGTTFRVTLPAAS
jgi:signal transduction histidine kinase